MAKKQLPKIIQKKINAYLHLLRQDKLSIQKVFLFGSWANGHARKDSDIDLCVVSKNFNKIDPWQYLWSKRIELDDYVIQPIGFTVKDFRDEDPLAYEIKKTGIAW
ncbi:MAG: nucleotidyltransferase domain-containing protein [Candidatus Jacksonbacteria bacterium]